MSTLVKSFASVDASPKNFGYLDLEPAITFPHPEDMYAYFRLGRTLASTLENLASGGVDATFSGRTNYTINPQSLVSRSDGYATITGAQPLAPCTIVSVIHQTAASPSAVTLLGGFSTSTGSGAGGGLLRYTSGNYGAIHRVSSINTTTTSFAADGGERIEMICAVFDDDADEMRCYRPRTETEAITPFSGWATTGNSVDRLMSGGQGTHTGEIEGVLRLGWHRALSKSELDALYLSVKASLASSGIDI